MAHIRDLAAAREAAQTIDDPYDKAEILAEVAKASALTDIASALEDFSRDFKEKRFESYPA